MLTSTLLAAGCSDRSTQPEAVVKSPRLDPIEVMHQAMYRSDWKTADEYTQKALIAKPNDPDLITDVAKVRAMSDRKREAAQLLIEAATMANFQPPSRVDFAVQALIDVGELYSAMDMLERSLQVHPQNAKHRRTLIGFLGEAQRLEKIQPHLHELIRQRQFDFPLLSSVTETSSRRFLASSAKMLMNRNPDDHRVRLGEAIEFFNRHNLDQAETVLKEILAHYPNFAPAHAYLGQVLTQQRKFSEIAQWVAAAPSDSDAFAEYWLTLGHWALEQQKIPEACNAFWRATQRDPNLGGAWADLSNALRMLQQAKSAVEFEITDAVLESIDARIQELLELRRRFYSFSASARTSQHEAAQVAQSLMNLGRNWEAEAWAAAATTLTTHPADNLIALRSEILERIKQDASWQSQVDQLALQMNLGYFPQVIVSAELNDIKRPQVVPSVTASDHLRLVEESKLWGLETIGGKNNPTDARLAALIRSTGVGGGAIDYDLDGWQDLIVMGAGGTMLLSDSMPNELLRNVDQKFVKVTGTAGVGDTGFGQGVAVGDINEDGFPDLFFANLGPNRLYINHGDGTFADSTELLGTSEPEWTTSAAFVDMNGDGLTDLLSTNYCDVVPNLDQACPNDAGELGPCHPLKFPANGDQFFISEHDGRLIDNTDQWIPHVAPGRGLGIVAGKLDSQNMSVFIANDMSANHYFTHVDVESRLIESAAARGVAVDQRTMTQASMGIAASDFDDDGDLDLYVTGFAREYNIYYEQLAPGFWRDETSRLRLVTPTLMVVGFGTQAIDLDNDGIDEIIVTNGHIGEFVDDPEAPPYEQPLQIFRRDQQGGFELMDDDLWGEYFATSHVGRALWTVDVNRDGNEDVLITHTHEPICLLVNRSSKQNHCIAFRLVGTHSSRDAIGAIIRFDCGGRSRTLWALSGDGYFCSNERILRTGLGDLIRVDNVTITWQDGREEKIGSLEADSEYLIIEGSAEAFGGSL